MDIKEFEALSAEEQEKIFHHTPFKEKGELLLHAHEPDRLTRSLSQEELYLVTREMDLEERTEVIRYASLPQLFFLADIDCWKGDRIDPKHFTQWLEVLLNADERKLFAWMTEMDPETVISGFKKVMQVLKPDHEYAADELLGDTPYFTLDNMYYICVPEESLETVKRAVEVLYENQRGRYVALLEEILSQMDDVLEEDAFQRREMRLAERGFPDRESARKIYRPITPEEFASVALKSKPAGSAAESDAPRYPVLRQEEKIFLDDVLLLFHDEDIAVRDQLQEELAWLSNKVIAAEGIDFSSEERVRAGIDRARNLVSLGLEMLSKGDLEKAKEIMATRWLELIFRWGITPVMQLKEGVQKIAREFWQGNQTAMLEFLNAPYDQIAAGLLRLFPQFSDRDFCTLADLDRTAKSTHQLLRLHQWLARVYPKAFDVEKDWLPSEDQTVTLFSILGTGFAHFVLKGKLAFEPLTEKEFQDFLARPREKEKFLEHFFTQQDIELLRSFWGVFFDQLEEELGRLNISKGFEPQYISMVSFRRPAKRDGEILGVKRSKATPGISPLDKKHRGSK